MASRKQTARKILEGSSRANSLQAVPVGLEAPSWLRTSGLVTSQSFMGVSVVPYGKWATNALALALANPSFLL